MIRGIDVTPHLGQVFQKVSIRPGFQEPCGGCFPEHPAGQHSSNEVDEFRANDREIALYAGTVEAEVIFVPVKNQFQQPSVGITDIGRFRVKIFIRFEDDHTENTGFFIIPAVGKVFVLFSVGKKCCFLGR